MAKITSKHILILCLLSFVLVPAKADIGMQELGDSLTAWTGFSSVWSPVVKVKNLRVNGNKITVKTNKTLKDVRWTTANIAELKRKVSRWVLGHERGKVTIQTANIDIENLVTNCAKGILATGKPHDLAERNIALYPSHGLYYNRE